MAEHRQGKRRLGDEHVARNRHEAGAGGIGGALVVAADHHPRCPGTPSRPGRCPAHARPAASQTPHVADAQRLAPASACCVSPARSSPRRACISASVSALASTAPMAGTGMIGMRMGDHRAVHRPGRIDEEAAGLAVKALRQDAQPGATDAAWLATLGRRFPPAARANRTAAMNGTLPEPFAGWFAAQGWAPRRHQLAMLDAARAGESVLLIAPTGGGKTLAGFLPTLVALAEAPRSRHPHAVCQPAEGAGHRHRAQPDAAGGGDAACGVDRDAHRRHAGQPPCAPAGHAAATSC